MKLRNIHIHNFRSIHDSSFDLEDFALMVGANNSGKTTVLSAILALYEKDGFKFIADRDFPFGVSGDEDSWIDATYELSQSEYESLAEHYRLSNQRLKVRKYFKTADKIDGKSVQGNLVGYTSDSELHDKLFYGPKSVQNGKIGDLIYIPAVSKVDDHAKTTGPSALRDLLNTILKDLFEKSPAFKKFADDFQHFSSNVKSDTTDSGASINDLEGEISSRLKNWSTTFELNFKTPSASDIVKSLAQYNLFDDVFGEKHTAEQFGSGFQRHFIYSLIEVAASFDRVKPQAAKKEFQPDYTLLLFEEPEAFLHPPQQMKLAAGLRSLGGSPTKQVICSTHSPHFVSAEASSISSIVRLRRDRGITRAFQVSRQTWEKLADKNQNINLIKQVCPDFERELGQDDSEDCMEGIKYFLWLNPDRCGMFFAQHVIFVEGPSELGLINRLLGDRKLEIPQGTCVVDCIGKFNVHRFMNLAIEMGIDHVVIIDDDNGSNKPSRSALNELISKTRSKEFTLGMEMIRGNLEQLLGLERSEMRRWCKPWHLIYLYDSGKIGADKINSFCAIINGVCKSAWIEPNESRAGTQAVVSEN